MPGSSRAAASFAFILVVVPLVVAGGAGASSCRALGITVFGGMLVATPVGIFFVPMLYVVTEALAERRRKAPVLATALSMILLLNNFGMGPNFKRPDLPVPTQFRANTAPAFAESLADRK